MPNDQEMNYKSAGVDIAAGNLAVKRIKTAVESTFSPHVLTSLGSFAAMLDLKTILADYQHPVLVQSIDGVGTKMMVAKRMQKFDTIGIDLVSATTNDIIVLGAKPLTLLDYIANDELKPHIIEEIIQGMVQACLENDIALVGGETAEMPGTYLRGEHDLVGVITGVLEKERAITGKHIQPGDVILAFPSSGLHTNGYSLARHLFFKVAKFSLEQEIADYNATLGEVLLTPHLNYTRPVLHLLKHTQAVKGMAHITGGGVLENLPRILPAHCAAEIHLAACPQLPIFAMMQAIGKLDAAEMYRIFNMGIGYVMVVAANEVVNVQSALSDYAAQFPIVEIGRIVAGNQTVRLI